MELSGFPFLLESRCDKGPFSNICVMADRLFVFVQNLEKKDHGVTILPIFVY